MDELHTKDQTVKQVEKAKIMLIVVGAFSVTMLFMGLISGYIVSMGDSFWLKVPFPSAFWISTALIIGSSACFILGGRFAKAGKQGMFRIMMMLALVTSLGFVFFQFKGYGQLVDNGVYASNKNIIVTDGRYGDYFDIKKGEEYIDVNGNDYLLSGKKMSEKEMKDLQAFMKQFEAFDVGKAFEVTEYDAPYTLLFNKKQMTVEGGHLKTKEGKELKILDRERLSFLARNILDGRGDFFVRGEMGEDFHIYYKGKELTYKDRKLNLDGKELSPYLQLKAMESADTASSYLYIITFLHLLHVLITVIAVFRVTIRTVTGKINETNLLGFRMTAIFWHFLGLLWLGLLLFLLFIH